MSKESIRTLNLLFGEGIKSYLDAAMTINRFHKEVRNSARKILDKRLPLLSDAMGLKLKPENIRDYDEPDIRTGIEVGEWAFITVFLDLSKTPIKFGKKKLYVNQLQCGLWLDRDDDGTPWGAAAMPLYHWYKGDHSLFLSACEEIRNEVKSSIGLHKDAQSYELIPHCRLTSERYELFADDLYSLIDFWIKVFSIIRSSD